MRKLLIGLVATVTLTTCLIVANIEAYQTCNTALQVTFKSGHNLHIDSQDKIIDMY